MVIIRVGEISPVWTTESGLQLCRRYPFGPSSTMPRFWIHDWLRRFSWWGIIISLALAGKYGRLYATLPVIVDHPRTDISLDWPSRPAAPTLAFDSSVFKKCLAEPVAAVLGPLAKRFRLAGTFFAIGNSQQSRRAIIDDLQRKEQQLVAEGDLLDQTVMIVSIFPERIIVREGDRDEELRLSFSGDRPLPADSNQMDKTVAGALEMLNRFGKRVGETRWVLQRDEMLKYYQELLNNTERLAKVFDSLKPVYKASHIAGYVLKVEGEGDMFNALGLKQDDVIRKLNSVPMISQSRAEYFIREFVNNRVNGFVLDIERSGKPEKLVYLVR